MKPPINALIIALIAALTIAGCGRKGDPTPPQTDPAQVEETATEG